jgi:hypothetical protein
MRVLLRYVRLTLAGRFWQPQQLDLSQMGGDFVFDARGRLFLQHPSQASDDRPAPDVLLSSLREAVRTPSRM